MCRRQKRTTFAIGLQLNLYEGDYAGFSPINAAIAKNESCTGPQVPACFTYSNAAQSTCAVNFRRVDWEDLGEGLERLEKDLDRIESQLKKGRITAQQAGTQVDGIVERFFQITTDLGGNCSLLEDQ